jgi:hypothetical protein
MEVAMTIRHRLIAGLGLCCIAFAPANAQDNLPNTGVDPLATEKAPNTTAVGQTKPPSRDASPTSVRAIERPTPRQAGDDTITTRICTGCKPDPATTGAVTDATDGQDLSEKRGTKLDELRTMAPPQQQSDLNTVELASAHRERARSMQEKTNGLWQSWLVSVCEGCGDQKAVRSLQYEEWPDRNAPLSTGTVKKISAEKPPQATSAPVTRRPQGTLEANLSPDNVDSIRRMPQR